MQAPAFQAALQDALQPLVAQAEQKFAEEALACHSDLRDILADLSSLQTQLANPTQVFFSNEIFSCDRHVLSFQ